MIPSFDRFRRPAIAALAVVALAAHAHAAPSSETAALKRFEEGKKAFEAGEFESALSAFQDSLQLLPSPNTRLYIGRCYRAIGKPASAFTAFRLSAREASDRLNATGEKRYKATRDAATTEASDIEAKVPRLTIAVPSDAPEGLVVKLDDADVPKAAWGAAVETDPGKHRLTASGTRRAPFDTAFVLKEGEQLKVDVKIPRLPTGVLKLVLQSRPSGLEIRIDDAPVDPSEWDRPKQLDAGAHTVVARAPGYEDFTFSKSIEDGERADVDIALTPAAAFQGRGTPKWLFFGVAGLSVVVVGGGTYLAIQAKSKSNAQKALDPLERDPAERDKVRTTSTQANVLFVAGGALAVGAGVLFFTTNWKGVGDAPPQSARVVPWVGPGVAGLASSGSF